MNLVKPFSAFVIVYMILGISWWALLLYKKNELYYDRLFEEAKITGESLTEITREKNRQNLMIVGEGLVLGLSLMAGIWIIYRSAKKEIQAVNQQNNFILSVSHELKSPIAAVKLALQTLQKHKLDPADSNELTGRAVQDIDRLQDMVQNILLSAKLDEKRLELNKEVVSLNNVLLRLINKQDWKIANVNLKSDPGSWPSLDLSVDAESIELALSNIVDNAHKYSPRGSIVEITVNKEDNWCVIHIDDEGIGIMPEQQEKVFDRFYRSENTLESRRPGTGLGLYISNQIIKAHGGYINITAREKVGTRISVSLPVHD